MSSGVCIWFTGLSGAGKTTIVSGISASLSARGVIHDVLDGDEVRRHISRGLGFSKDDRDENIERITYVASKIVKHGGLVFVGAISPYRKMRDRARAIIEGVGGRFVEVHVSTSLEECERRDVKGLYAKARSGDIPNFTGISDPYEPPRSPEISIDTSATVEECAAEVLGYVASLGAVDDKKRAAFFGRFQPFHKGHEWLIRKKLDLGIPVLVLVRDIPADEKNPFSPQEAKSMIEAGLAGEDAKVQIVSDIESVNWGRGVGYEVNEFKPPEGIERISATDIRKRISIGDESWQGFVNPLVAEWLLDYYGEQN